MTIRAAGLFIALVASLVVAPARAEEPTQVPGLKKVAFVFSKPEFLGCASGEAAKCAQNEQCQDDMEGLEYLLDFQRRYKPKEPANVAHCNAVVTPEISESDCLGSNNQYCTIFFKGEITPKVASTIENLLLRDIASRKRGRIWVYLDSPGGDVESALRIGRLFRRVKVTAIVDTKTTCASACVFVLAGAPLRRILGAVVVHRPYRPEAVVLGSAEAQRLYNARNIMLRSYLSEMNVSPLLVDDMNTISPDEWRELESDDRRRYGLIYMDPILEDEKNAKEAIKRGISVREYLKRKVEYGECVDKYTWNEGTLQECTYALDRVEKN